MAARHFRSKNCRANEFYATNNWSNSFNQLQTTSIPTTIFLNYISTPPGDYKLYVARNGESIFTLKYIGVSRMPIKSRFDKHKSNKTFDGYQNIEYAIVLSDLNKNMASFFEGLLLLSTRLGFNLINKQYEFQNILNCLTTTKNDEIKEIILKNHQEAIMILKQKWELLKWIKF